MGKILTRIDHPQEGDRIIAERCHPSRIYHNRVIGPVLATWENCCRVVCNEGTETETDFQLFFGDWKFWRIES